MSNNSNRTLGDGYNPYASEMSNDDLQKWLSASLVDDIRQVPGIDYKNANLLSVSSAAGDGITTSHQLLGVFLLCKGLGVQCEENCARFHSWLKAKGIINHTSTVVKACAEKCNQYFPGVYDESVYSSLQGKGSGEVKSGTVL